MRLPQAIRINWAKSTVRHQKSADYDSSSSPSSSSSLRSTGTEYPSRNHRPRSICLHLGEQNGIEVDCAGSKNFSQIGQRIGGIENQMLFKNGNTTAKAQKASPFFHPWAAESLQALIPICSTIRLRNSKNRSLYPHPPTSCKSRYGSP